MYFRSISDYLLFLPESKKRLYASMIGALILHASLFSAVIVAPHILSPPAHEGTLVEFSTIESSPQGTQADIPQAHVKKIKGLKNKQGSSLKVAVHKSKKITNRKSPPPMGSRAITKKQNVLPEKTTAVEEQPLLAEDKTLDQAVEHLPQDIGQETLEHSPTAMAQSEVKEVEEELQRAEELNSDQPRERSYNPENDIVVNARNARRQRLSQDLRSQNIQSNQNLAMQRRQELISQAEKERQNRWGKSLLAKNGGNGDQPHLLAQGMAGERRKILEGSGGSALRRGFGSQSDQPFGVRDGSVDARNLKQVPGNRKPDYPSASRLKRQQGQVLLTYFVTNEGLVTNLQLHQSSGFKKLDESAMAAIKNYRYFRGQSGWVYHPIDFKLLGEPKEISARLRM